MSPTLAAFACAAFVLWLFYRDAKKHEGSAALWLPFVWACIIGSQPVSFWLGTGGMDGEDTMLDKGVFLFLIIAGCVVLSKRRPDWGRMVSRNQWLVIFFVYLGLSIVWSDNPFTAFKRWIKDVGNIIMVLVILSEKDPIVAIRLFLSRCVYLLIPLSVVVVKYYPWLSVDYDHWSFKQVIHGISNNKNTFGMTLFVSALSLFWMWFEDRKDPVRRKDKTKKVIYIALMLMTAWLLMKARSSTALVCSVMGAGIVWGLQFAAVRARVSRLGAYAAAACGTVLVLQMSGLWDMLITAFAHMVGRDPSFHGRTAIWQSLLKEDINPLLGTGYYSFWSKERAARISAKYFYTLNEAHNGYLETYLNSGVIGLVLLLLVLFFAMKWVKREVVAGAPFGAFRLAIFVAALFYAMSEAIFNRLTLMWFILLLTLIDFPKRVKVPAVAPVHEPQPEKEKVAESGAAA